MSLKKRFCINLETKLPGSFDSPVEVADHNYVVVSIPPLVFFSSCPQQPGCRHEEDKLGTSRYGMCQRICMREVEMMGPRTVIGTKQKVEKGEDKWVSEWINEWMGRWTCKSTQST